MTAQDRTTPPSAVPAEVLSRQAGQLVEATALAWEWHGTQTRKGRATSYMSHLLQVNGLVISAGGGPAEAIAALLHDGLEDAPDPGERARREALIQERFGEAVLRIVLDCTDTTPQEAGTEKGPWRERKERYLGQLRTAGPGSLLVAACDKQQNLGDIVSDLRHEGLATMARFNAGPAQQIWYFESLNDLFRDAVPARLVQELEELLDVFRNLTTDPKTARG